MCTNDARIGHGSGAGGQATGWLDEGRVAQKQILPARELSLSQPAGGEGSPSAACAMETMSRKTGFLFSVNEWH